MENRNNLSKQTYGYQPKLETIEKRGLQPKAIGNIGRTPKGGSSVKKPK